MPTPRDRKIMGAGLITAGVLFLLVSNKLLLRWDHVWPLFLLLGGGLFLRVNRSKHVPEVLFAGVCGVLLGVFLLLFSFHIVPWSQMSVLWPAIPSIAGIGLMSVSLANRQVGTSLVVGASILAFTVLAFMLETELINPRVAEPFVRFWPLVLVVAGIVMLRMERPPKEELDPDMKAVREILDEEAPVLEERQIPPGLESSILDHVKSADSPDDAVAALVQGIKSNFARFSWVGVYRLQGETLTIPDAGYLGSPPEYREVKLTEGICGAAASERKTIIVPNVNEDDRYLACSRSVKSEMVVPLLDGDDVVAVLDIDSDELNAFGDADVRFVESLVSKASPFIRLTQASV